MIDYVLAGLSAGLFAFLVCFIVSFVALGVVVGLSHLTALVLRMLLGPKRASCREQAI